jgi:thioredoxin-dependent peroxiredoxin
MAQVTLRGNPFSTSGELPAVGAPAPGFSLVGSDLSEITADSLSGKKVVLNIFPSIDTPTCATSVRTFNERAAGRDDTVVLCVSEDLPFAAGRFCGAEGIENVKTGSAFRSTFADDYGVRLEDGPLAGLTARSVVVLDADGTVVHTQLVAEIANEPDYDAALAALD